MQSREQQFARVTYDQVRAYAEAHPKGSEQRTKYGGMAHTLPILIRTSGLAQALAFVESRGKDPHRDLLNHLARTLLGDTATGNQLATRSRTAELPEYMSLTERAMLALKWYKRYAQSVLEVDITADEGSRT
jgi:CRISPR-associated protein Cmr5